MHDVVSRGQAAAIPVLITALERAFQSWEGFVESLPIGVFACDRDGTLVQYNRRAAELWGLLNPVNHTRTPAEVAHYKVEPYVVCADVYGAPPHTGRGGWTWYTGAAGWLYRVAVEAILGVRVRGDSLRFEPCVPAGWPGYEVAYRFGTATYHVSVDNPAGAGRGVRAVTADGQPAGGEAVPLRDDGQTHEVRVVLG